MCLKYLTVITILSVIKIIDSNSPIDHMNCSHSGYTTNNEAFAESRQSQLPPDGSLAQILVVSPADPAQHPQPPLLFMTDTRPPIPDDSGPVHIGHISDDNSFTITNDNRVPEVSEENEESSPSDTNKQPPFFVKVEGKAAPVPSLWLSPTVVASKPEVPKPGPISTTVKPTVPPTTTTTPITTKPPMTTTAKPTEPPTTTTTLPPGPAPQPLPPAAKPLSEKKDCVVLGRAGNCFPYFPFSNIFNCFTGGGIVAMDIVRCTWVRACCVHNFF